MTDTQTNIHTTFAFHVHCTVETLFCSTEAALMVQAVQAGPEPQGRVTESPRCRMGEYLPKEFIIFFL